MIVNEIKGNLFDFCGFNTGSVILHGCNNMGVMGAGFALQFKNLYPLAFENYREHCTSCFEKGKPSLDILGGVSTFRENGNILICGITQHLIKSYKNPVPAKVQYIKAVLDTLFTYKDKLSKDKIIHCPRIGCGLGGLDWESEVKEIFEDSHLQFNIYSL